MATLNLAAYKPSSGQAVSASPISNAMTAIEAAVNSVDNTQFASGRIFDPTKLIEASSVQRIADSALGAPAASFDFTSISANYAHLLICSHLRADPAAQTVVSSLRFNNDSAGNYYFENLDASNATVTSSVNNAQTSGRCLIAAGASGSAGAFLGGFLLVPYYSQSVSFKSWIAMTGGVSSSGTGNAGLNGGLWAAAAAVVNRITILPSSGNFIAGSRVTIYGLG